MKTIRLGKGLVLPANQFATNVVAALGMRGSGKSNSLTLAAEELLKAGIQVVVLDYVGIFFGLRLLPDGKPSSFQIPVLGGHHGDIALVPAAGQQVAEALAASHSSAVLDISLFKKGDRIRFAADFGEAFFHAKKLNEGPVFLILEEAQRFVPQLIRFSDPGLSRCLGAYEEIAEVGRNYGIGLGLISQRPQKINKDVLNLAELVFAFQTNGVLERKAIAEWVQEKDAQGRDEVAGELPGLPRGTALVWSPSTFKLYGKYVLDKKTTYDAGATPERARAAVKVKQLDLASLESAMAVVVAEAKVNDPRALRTRVAELEKELARARAKPVPPSVVPKPAPAPPPPRPLISSADVARLEKLTTKLAADEAAFVSKVEIADKRLRGSYDEFASKVGAWGSKLEATQKEVAAAIGGLRQIKILHDLETKTRSVFPAPPTPKAPRPASPASPASPAWEVLANSFPAHAPTDDRPKPLTKCARALLAVVAQREKASASQISTLSGYRKTSSTFDNGLSELRVRGLIAGKRDAITATEAGKEEAGPVDPLPSGDDLLEHWTGQLSKAEGTMLKIIRDHLTIDKHLLSELSGYQATSSTFDNALSRLRVLELIHGPRGGDVTISDTFLE